MLENVMARPSGIDGPGSADDVRAAVERYRDAVNRHDIDAVVAAFTDDGLIDCTPPPDGERYEGAAGITALFRQLYELRGRTNLRDRRDDHCRGPRRGAVASPLGRCLRATPGTCAASTFSAFATGRSPRSSLTSRADRHDFLDAALRRDIGGVILMSATRKGIPYSAFSG